LVDIPGRPAFSLKGNRRTVDLEERGGKRDTEWRGGKGGCGLDVLYDKNKKKKDYQESIVFYYVFYSMFLCVFGEAVYVCIQFCVAQVHR
jgi:hypothetical protein